MRNIKDELLKEKMNPSQNKRAIQFIQRAMEGYFVNKVDFSNTMRVEPVINNQGLHQDCQELLHFAGGFVVQGLKDGKYFYDANDAQELDEMSTQYTSDNLKDMVSFIWKNEANNFFNRIK